MNFTMYTGFTRMVGQVGIAKTAEYAANLGFSSVEMLSNGFIKNPGAIPDVASAKEARVILADKGLSVACHSVYINLWQDEAAVRRVMDLVEIAAALGTPYFHHTVLTGDASTKDAPSFDDAMNAAADAAERIANHAETFGITCIYEDQGDYLNGVEGFGAFYREMKRRCRNVGVCGDVGNIMFVDEKPEDFFKAYIEDICHVHIKDYLLKEADSTPGTYWKKAANRKWLRETIVGDGVINIEACMKLLKTAGYKGAFALENSHPEPYDAGVTQAMECLKRFW